MKRYPYSYTMNGFGSSDWLVDLTNIFSPLVYEVDKKNCNSSSVKYSNCSTPKESSSMTIRISPELLEDTDFLPEGLDPTKYDVYLASAPLVIENSVEVKTNPSNQSISISFTNWGALSSYFNCNKKTFEHKYKIFTLNDHDLTKELFVAYHKGVLFIGVPLKDEVTYESKTYKLT